MQDILDSFEFRNQIPRLSRADALGTLIEKLTSPDINLSPYPVMNADGAVRHPGLDNHGMGTIFEELVRRFNEEAGEHWTPRDAVRLMAKLVFLPAVDEIESGTYLLYDGACGTGGMLTVAEETLRELAAERGKQVSTHLYGQEINAETYAICKADLLLKGEGKAADNIVGGPEHSTLANDAFPSREFDFMLSNPPYGKSWKTDLERMGGKKYMRDPRFVIEHRGDPEYSLVTRSSDGQMLFLACGVAEIKALKQNGTRSENAPPVIRRIHKRGTEADPLRGRFETTIDAKPAVVEYEPDAELRDTEQIPLQEEGGIEAFLRREVLPYAADAWYRPDSVKVGYEISFNRYFYQLQPMRTLEEIMIGTSSATSPGRMSGASPL